MCPTKTYHQPTLDIHPVFILLNDAIVLHVSLVATQTAQSEDSCQSVHMCHCFVLVMHLINVLMEGINYCNNYIQNIPKIDFLFCINEQHIRVLIITCRIVESLFLKSLYDPSPFSYIMLTRPCNVYPLTPHFYIVKLGFTGVYIILLFLLSNIDCGYSLEPPH